MKNTEERNRKWMVRRIKGFIVEIVSVNIRFLFIQYQLQLWMLGGYLKLKLKSLHVALIVLLRSWNILSLLYFHFFSLFLLNYKSSLTISFLFIKYFTPFPSIPYPSYKTIAYHTACLPNITIPFHFLIVMVFHLNSISITLSPLSLSLFIILSLIYLSFPFNLTLILILINKKFTINNNHCLWMWIWRRGLRLVLIQDLMIINRILP